MTATYTHVVTSEQIAGRYRSTWKMPGSEKAEELKIFGIDVDSSTFRKYNHQNYTIGFHFTDLRGVEFWATNAEVAVTHPETVAEAKQLMQKIITEITGKDMKTMNTPRTAADFIDALNDILTESRNAYAVLQNKVDKAAAKMEQAREELRDPSCKYKQLAQFLFDIAQGEYNLAQAARRSEYRDMISEHEKKVAVLREQFAVFLDDYYAASPDKLDVSTMALLDAGICTASDLVRLADRHAGNPTMLRILGARAKEMRSGKISDADRGACVAVITAADAARNGDRELAIFDGAVSAATYGLAEDHRHASNMYKHVPGWFDAFRDQIQNLHNIPKEV